MITKLQSIEVETSFGSYVRAQRSRREKLCACTARTYVARVWSARYLIARECILGVLHLDAYLSSHSKSAFRGLFLILTTILFYQRYLGARLPIVRPFAVPFYINYDTFLLALFTRAFPSCSPFPSADCIPTFREREREGKRARVKA